MDGINATPDQERVQERVTAAVIAYRTMLDTFVNNAERRIASEAEQARPGQSKDTPCAHGFRGARDTFDCCVRASSPESLL